MANPRKKSSPSPPATWLDAVPVTPNILEYQPAMDREPWRVDKFQDLVAEFDAEPRQGNWEKWMIEFHEVAATYSRGWLFVRRLFGVQPLAPPENAHPDDFKVWTRVELCREFNLEPDQLKAEFEMIRVLWKSARTAQLSPGAEEKKQAELLPVAAAADTENLFKELGFSEKMFEINVVGPDGKTESPRPPAENLAEKAWFTDRIDGEHWKMMLREPMSAVVAREAVLNELALRRLDREMSQLNPTGKRYQDLRSTKRDIYEQYQGQITELQGMFPGQSIAGKVQARTTVAALVEAVKQYKANKDNALVDGIRTIHEIDIELTASVQSPLPAYRTGQSIYLLEARHHLFDPNYRSKLRHGTLRLLDKALPEEMARIREALSMPLPDLEKGVLPGEGDDFENFPQSEQTEAEKIANS